MNRRQAETLLKDYEVALLEYHYAGKAWTKAQLDKTHELEEKIIIALTMDDFVDRFREMIKIVNEVQTR